MSPTLRQMLATQARAAEPLRRVLDELVQAHVAMRAGGGR